MNYIYLVLIVAGFTYLIIRKLMDAEEITKITPIP